MSARVARITMSPLERVQRLTPAVVAKFLARVEKGGGDGCWIWTGLRDVRGYGTLYVSNTSRPRYERAPRIALMLDRGPIPHELLACHHCDNPPCVRPDHLFLGTMRDNIQDAVRKGRVAVGERHGMRLYPERICRGERVGSSTLTAAQVIEMRERFARGGATIMALSRLYGITESTARSLLRGETWRHIGGPLTTVTLAGRQPRCPICRTWCRSVVGGWECRRCGIAGDSDGRVLNDARQSPEVA